MLNFLLLFWAGSSTQNWADQDCAGVQVYYRQHCGGEDSGACGNETAPGFHSHPARQVDEGASYLGCNFLLLPLSTTVESASQNQWECCFFLS